MRMFLTFEIVTMKDYFWSRILKHFESKPHIYTSNEPMVPKKVPGPPHSIEKKIKLIIIFQDDGAHFANLHVSKHPRLKSCIIHLLPVD